MTESPPPIQGNAQLQQEQPANAIGSWARLYRLALAPTIIWDVAAGCLLSQLLIDQSSAVARTTSLRSAQEVQDASDFLPLQISITVVFVLFIFHGGMALNDWADRKIDADAGRKRPIPLKLIAPKHAFIGGLLPILFAGLLAWLWHPEAKWIFALILLVLVYNLGTSTLRAGIGPLLLSLCRSLSFASGILLFIDPANMASSNARWAIGGYALYVLFLSRMASKEEHGGHGMNMLPFVGLMVLSPFAFAQMSDGNSWVLYCGWIALACWHFIPALPDRHIFWAPERVQAAVRRSLTAMPMLPALALVAAGANPAWVLVGLAVSIITTLLARRMAPE